MAEPQGRVAFVVAGSPPEAVAIGAQHVRRIAPEHSFSGERVVDLRSLGPDQSTAPGGGGSTSHVVVVGAQPQEIGVLVRGRIRLLVVESSEILPLPATIERPSRMSHVIVSEGVPRIPVVDLARFDAWDAVKNGLPETDSEK